MLSSIWNLLVTEDELLTKIVTIPMLFVEIWLGFLLLSTILNLDYKPRQKRIYIIFVSILTLINEFLIPAPYNIIFNYLMIFIFIKLYFKLNIIKTILSIIIPTAIFAIINTLLLKPFLVLTQMNYEDAYNVPLYRLLYLCILYPIVFFITLLLKNIKVTLHFVSDLNQKNKIIILLNALLGFFTL